MSTSTSISSTDPTPNVILLGGPPQVGDTERMQYVADVETTLKLPLGNAYEHFEPTPETTEHQGRLLRVFQWSRRTYVAE